jgi:hypothetical protein
MQHYAFTFVRTWCHVSQSVACRWRCGHSQWHAGGGVVTYLGVRSTVLPSDSTQPRCWWWWHTIVQPLNTSEHVRGIIVIAFKLLSSWRHGRPCRTSPFVLITHRPVILVACCRGSGLGCIARAWHRGRQDPRYRPWQ